MKTQCKLTLSTWSLMTGGLFPMYLGSVQFEKKKKKVSWCNTIPGSQENVITLKFNSDYMSCLPRRWILEIG
ncbi:hypothetical protein ACQP3D_29335, partial [Escherichia coli]